MQAGKRQEQQTQGAQGRAAFYPKAYDKMVSDWQVSWLSSVSPPSHAALAAQWPWCWANPVVKMTVAGTAQDLHLFPF